MEVKLLMPCLHIAEWILHNRHIFSETIDDQRLRVRVRLKIKSKFTKYFIE
jgi:hypothetical protein